MPRGKEMRIRSKVIQVIGPSIAYLDLGNDEYVLIDSADADRVGCYSWGLWTCRNIKYCSGSPGLLHRFILRARKGEGPTVDHANLNTRDNRSANLRFATPSQQAANRRKRKENTSGAKGVTFDKRMGKFVAQIGSRSNGKRKNTYLGSFASFEDAVEAYSQEHRARYGEFSRP